MLQLALQKKLALVIWQKSKMNSSWKTEFSQNSVLRIHRNTPTLFNIPKLDYPKWAFPHTWVKDFPISNWTYSNLIFPTIRSNVFL